MYNRALTDHTSCTLISFKMWVLALKNTLKSACTWILVHPYFFQKSSTCSYIPYPYIYHNACNQKSPATNWQLTIIFRRCWFWSHFKERIRRRGRPGGRKFKRFLKPKCGAKSPAGSHRSSQFPEDQAGVLEPIQTHLLKSKLLTTHRSRWPIWESMKLSGTTVV